MKIYVFALVIFAVVLSTYCQNTPQKPVWPIQFSAPFGLYESNILIRIKNASSTFYYNWEVESQLIDYTEHCFPFAAIGARKHPCKMFFNPKGIFLQSPDLDINCCTMFPGVGGVPPNFLRGFNYSSIETADDYYGDTHTCNYWVGIDGFAYWTDEQNGHDVKFKDGNTGVTWQWGSFQVGPQDPSMFDLPSGDCSKSCIPFGLKPFEEQDIMFKSALKYHGYNY
eukprot:TRINITY_DN1554_c1_g1_i1.p1 TRINITY_DN1554_c1_g1~~TRINITY_DN1554_c1_g1_i1.p1  ORF type:complete len:251 (+),score=69.09 TRINITY_DN1554_c1_g1_i1:81-755(+)